MNRAPKISETEWEVMKVIWRAAPCSADEVIRQLTGAEPSRHPKTIKTFLGRLVGKRVLGFHKEGRAYVYRPLVTEEQCVEAASQSFLQRVFGGSLKPMLAHFVEHKRLSAKEIQELKKLLDEKESGL